LIQNKTDISGFEKELLDENFNFGKVIKYIGKSALEKYQQFLTHEKLNQWKKV